MREPEKWQKLHKQKRFELLFQALVDQYSESLYWHIRAMVLRHDWADDVLQNTFIKAWRALASFRGESKFHTWLYRIASREALALLKKEQRFQIGSEHLDYQLQSDPYFDGDQALEKLLQVVAELPERQQMVFRLKYFQNLSFKEISARLSVSEGALKASYHHANEKIKVQLNLKDL